MHLTSRKFLVTLAVLAAISALRAFNLLDNATALALTGVHAAYMGANVGQKALQRAE